jgi:hypothetical protein
MTDTIRRGTQVCNNSPELITKALRMTIYVRCHMKIDRELERMAILWKTGVPFQLNRPRTIHMVRLSEISCDHHPMIDGDHFLTSISGSRSSERKSVYDGEESNLDASETLSPLQSQSPAKCPSFRRIYNIDSLCQSKFDGLSSRMPVLRPGRAERGCFALPHSS